MPNAKNNMFTIDLLKGKNIPIKGGPEWIVVAAITFLVPAITAGVMFGFYLTGKIDTSIQKQEITKYEAKIEELREAIELQESFERERQAINSCLADVSSAIGKHTQWSPVLAALAENMPDSMLLNELDVKWNSVTIKRPKKDDPQKIVDITVPAKQLQISISGDSQYNKDKEVRDFMDRLRFSTLLGPKLQNIGFSQEIEKLGGQDIVSYQVDCIFKPEL